MTLQTIQTMHVISLQQMDHDLVLFTDDDTIPPLDWVEKLVRWFDNPEVGAVGGPNFAPDEDSFGAKCADVAFYANS